MKKRTWIIAALAVVILVAAACTVAYFIGRADEPPAVTEPNTPTEPAAPVEPEPTVPDAPEEKEEPVVVYVPDEQGESLTPVGTEAADDTDQSLVDALIASGALPNGVEVVSSSTDGSVLTLDMNAVYGDAVRASGTAGETMLIYSLVNSFLQARDAESILITVEGAPLESGHDIYDYPLTMREN